LNRLLSLDACTMSHGIHEWEGIQRQPEKDIICLCSECVTTETASDEHIVTLADEGMDRLTCEMTNKNIAAKYIVHKTM
jgi:hypothetical protein